jgi:3-oxoacyl-(acyl-carrier-protein) synthase
MVGVSTSAIEVIERGKDQMVSRGPAKVSSYIVSACQPHAVASALAISLGVETQVETISSACLAGLGAIERAYQMIRQGKQDIALAGGSDAPITPLTVASFGSTGMVPDWRGPPEKASRPFDRDRMGGILAEGCGFIVLENLEHALARGASPGFEIVGTGGSMDLPETESGSGLATSMSMALDNAGCLPDKVDYVCAHGPSDPVIDRVETEAIKAILGERAYAVPVSSIKGVTGNPLAAAGPLQLITCGLALRTETIPPTANYEHRDPECDLDYVPGPPRRAQIRTALLNVHGLGGTNGTVVVRKAEDP